MHKRQNRSTRTRPHTNAKTHATTQKITLQADYKNKRNAIININNEVENIEKYFEERKRAR